MAKLALCVSVMLVLLVALSESGPATLCCTKYYQNEIPVTRLKFYVMQEVTGNCNIKAVIFKTVRNRLVCANPEESWVQKAMKVVPGKR